LDISELMDHALMFPWVEERSKDTLFFAPSYFWQDLPIKHPSKWEEVTVYINQLIPGFDLTKLCISSSSFINASLNPDIMGRLWQDLVVASLMARYTIARMSLESKTVPFTNMYYLPAKSKAYNVIKDIKVNLSTGICCPQEEASVVTVSSEDCSIYFNKNIHNAHHDIILPAKPVNLAIQCKNSLSITDTKSIESQLYLPKQKSPIKKKDDRTFKLLWFYIGEDDFSEGSPVENCRSVEIFDAIRFEQLAFLSGSGCCSPNIWSLIQFFLFKIQ